MWKLLLISAFFITGCSTSKVVLKDIDVPLFSIKKTIENNLPVGKASESENGRVIRSKYYLKLGEKYVDATKMSRRFYAVVELLGDRRPYKVTVRVFKQKRVKKDGALLPAYADVGEDEIQSKISSRNILRGLNKRRDGVNVIDEFRVF